MPNDQRGFASTATSAIGASMTSRRGPSPSASITKSSLSAVTIAVPSIVQ